MPVIFNQPPFWATSPRHALPPHALSVLITPPVLEPLTLDQAKQRAGVDWAPGDSREALLTGFIAVARSKVEHDTGHALLTQTRDVYYDRLPGDVIPLPEQSTPLQSVTSITSTDTAGATHVLGTDQYLVDLIGGRIARASGSSWPTDLRTFQPWTIRIVSGWTTVAALPPLLVHAVGLLVAHYATLGRDLASVDSIEEVPQGYAAAIEPYQRVISP